MAWNNQGGPWGGGQSPWGRGGGSGGNQPPDFEEMIKRGQDRMKSILPGGFGSGRALTLIGAAAVVLWLVTGFYVVNPANGAALPLKSPMRKTRPTVLRIPASVRDRV